MHVIHTTGTTRPDGRIRPPYSQARGGTPPDNIEGAAYDAGVSLLFEDSDQDGEGPYLHQHPYAETFVIRGGKALFTVAGDQLIGVAGQVLVVPEAHTAQVRGRRSGALHRDPHPRQRNLHHRVVGRTPQRVDLLRRRQTSPP